MSMTPHSPLLLALAATVALGATALADAPDVIGPAIGNNRYRTAISDGSDTDDFTGRFLEGDALTVSVTALRGPKGAAATLRPSIVLVDPAGQARTVPATTSKTGLLVAVKGFRVDATGPWIVRVGGAGGTTGDYSVAFRVQGAGKIVLRNQTLGGADPDGRIHEFPGFDGALLDARITWKKGSSPVEIRALADPGGADVLAPGGTPAAASATSRAGRVELRKVPLSVGAGDYSLRLRTVSGAATYTLTLAVTPPKRPSGAKPVVLSSREPVLDALQSPVVADAGTPAHLTGANFSTSKPPAVFFCTSASPSVTVAADGRSLDAVVPPRTGPCVVTVTVVNPDGQGCRRTLHFAYMPAPEIVDLVDAGTGDPVRTSTSAGGRAVRIVGANFEPGQTVLVGGFAVASPTFLSDTAISLALPAASAGDRAITVTDAYGRVGTSPFTVRFKSPPGFAGFPYSPGSVLFVDTPVTLSIHGSGFETSDQVLIGGLPYDSAWIAPSLRTVTLPGLPAGTYSVRIVDSIGTAVDGPPLDVKGPATISSVTVVAGDAIGTDCVPLSGGSTVQVDGSDFLTNDVVTLGGAPITSFLVSTATQKRFVAPAGSPGSVDLTITDALGQSATLPDALSYAGLRDRSSSRVPTSTSADDRSAARAAAADLDGDGSADDVVLVSPYGDSTGTRAERTRVLLGDGGGRLVDATSASMPAARSDAARRDSWEAGCVAIGDLDGDHRADLVIGGTVAGSADAPQVRMFVNHGVGAFALDEAHQPLARAEAEVSGVYSYYDSYYYSWTETSMTVLGSSSQAGAPQAMALADLDGDGRPDLVVGTDACSTQRVYLDLSAVDLSTTPATIDVPIPVDVTRYLPATRVYLNRTAQDQRFTDVSSDHLPACGTTTDFGSPLPGLHCRDLALADVDGDGDLDLIVSWDEPRTVSALGLEAALSVGHPTDNPRTATRVLLNEGDGCFTTDATATWMPSTSGNEYWQADRILAADLDGDGDPDLVLLSRGGLDAWAGTDTRAARALRILRNDGTHFTDVSASALPSPAAGDDLRGDAVVRTDVDGDGVADLVLTTTTALRTAGGAAAPRLRVLFGGTDLTFRRGTGFSESVSADTGEASDLLSLGDLAGSDGPVLLLVGRTRPATSPASTPALRAQEWVR